jgi:molybdenum cofactor biosynthesis protein B
VLTVSDTRSLRATDTSGQLLVDRLTAAGHQLGRARVAQGRSVQDSRPGRHWIAEDVVQVVLITGGTGFTGRDSTPEAVSLPAG